MEQNLNKYYIEFRNEYLHLLVHWLRLTDSETEDLTTRRTGHSFYELQYVLSGALQIRTAEKSLRLKAGEFLVLPPGVDHEITSYEEHTKKLVFGFDAEFFSAELQTAMRHIELRKWREDHVMRSLSTLLIDIGTRTPGFGGVQIRCLTEALLFEIISLTVPGQMAVHPVCKKNDDSYKTELVERMTAYIRQKAGVCNVTVQEIADIFPMSKRHLSRLCEEVTGKTPRELINEERLKYLRELLTTTDYPLSKVSSLMGFSSENSMIRFFRSKEGYTPSQYRKYTTQ